ncbi:CbiX/SirB N-terminal domain-containing protein [soil metagenome]
MKRSALVLFAHGARDPQWAAPFERLQKITQAQMPDELVALAFLDLMSPGLPDLVPDLVRSGCEKVTIVPVFFGQGGHVLRDLPLMVDKLRSEFPQLSLKVVQAVGEDPSVLNAIADYCVQSIKTS